MHRLGHAICLAIFIFVPLRTIAQGGANNSATTTVSLMGTVYSERGRQPVEHAVVRLCDVGGSWIEEEITNDSGDFVFRWIQRGSYTLSVSADGFQPQSQRADLNFTSDRGFLVYLKPIEDSRPQAPAAKISAHEMSMPQSARELELSGEKKLYHDKDAQGGLVDFQQALTIASDYYEVHYQSAMAYLSLGKVDEAEQHLHKAIELSGDKYGDAEIGLGTLMINKGDFTGGENAMRRGLALAPESWLGHYELGRVLLNENRLEDAQKSAEQARSLSPNTPIVYRLLANIHLGERNYPLVLQDLDAYIKLDSDSAAGIRAKELRSQVAQKIGGTQEAVTKGPRP